MTNKHDWSLLKEFNPNFSAEEKKAFYLALSKEFEHSDPEIFESLVHRYELDPLISARFQAKLDLVKPANLLPQFNMN
jgi:hypothetical protein